MSAPDSFAFGGTISGDLDALLRQWLALRVDCNREGVSDDEADRITEEMEAIQHAILLGNPVSEADWRALAAMLALITAEPIPYRNTEAEEGVFQRLVIDRMPDPAHREKERRWSQRRIESAKAHLEELDQEASP